MKKLLCIIGIVTLLGFSGCSTKNETVNEFTPATEVMFDEVVKFEFEGHYYVWFRKISYLPDITQGGGIIHDPDCPCKVDYD